MTRNTCTAVCESNTWDLPIFISASVRSELEFCLKNCKFLPKKLVCQIHRTPERMFSDASAYVGAYLIDEAILKVSHVMWTEVEN